jgi:predicted dehydrogenase
MRKIRWGVIGSGGIARRRTIPEGIVPASNAALAAVYDVDAGVNRAVARQYGAADAVSLDALFAAGLDAVYVATPAHRHREHVEACARARLPVLCEKPLGMGVAEAEGMAGACRAAGVPLGTAFMMRFQSQHREALRLVREGRLGTPVYARAQLSCWYPPIAGAWRQDPALGGGGSLVDLGGHCIDLLEMFFGPVRRVSCVVRNAVHPYPVEDAAVALLEFAGGALGTVDACFCVRDEGSRNVLELHGSRGSILAAGTIGQGSAGEMTAILAEADGAYDAAQARAGGAGTRIAPEPVNVYRAEIEAFGQTVLEGRREDPGAEHGVRSQRILAACYASARSGRAVEVESFPSLEKRP